jgi:hypothetical protein
MMPSGLRVFAQNFVLNVAKSKIAIALISGTTACFVTLHGSAQWNQPGPNEDGNSDLMFPTIHQCS